VLDCCGSPNHTLHDIPPIRFVFQVTQEDLRSSLMMAGYCRNMQKPVCRIKERYNQCIVLVSSNTYNKHYKILIAYKIKAKYK
jgi:hypothetical protein